MAATAKGLGRICALAILLLAVVCPSAQATYPGGNGWISFEGPELHGAGPQIYVVKPDGRDAHAVTATMYLRGETRWSPDGRLLAIEGGNHYAAVMALSADSLDREPVVWGESVWSGGGAWGLPAWSGDGRRMVGLGWTETPYDPTGLYVASTISPADPRAAGQPYLVQGSWRGGTPVWSPDGSLLAFDGCRSDDGSTCGIWTMRPDQPDSARLIVRSDGTFPVHHPDWSPDSQRIAYEVGHTGGSGRGVHTVRRDGSDVRRISTGGYTPAYSPDGRRIVFSQQNGLYVMDVNGANHRRIFSGANLEPDWQRVDVPVSPVVTPPPPPTGPPPPPSPVNIVAALPPSTPSPAGSQELPRLTVREAKSAARRTLEKKYGSRFKRRARRGYQLTCRRLTDHRATCRVAWRHRGVRYRGTLKVARTADGLYVAPRVRRVSR